MDNLIVEILSTRRCHNSKGELLFVSWLREKLEKMECTITNLEEGCILADVGKPKKGKNILFSCHVDTCHSMAESDGTAQKLFFDSGLGHIFLDKSVPAGCLGADDGAGIYIMLKMIEAKVPGSYIFHRGEEKGGVGARAVVAKQAGLFKQYSACIAFDRPYNDEVIVTQGGQLCASVAYGQAVCDMFKAEGLDYAVSHKGIFTDSKVYRGIIRECLNIGVGYGLQHTKDEYLDWDHLSKLTTACCKVDWSKLVPKRELPVELPQSQYRGGYQGSAAYQAYQRELDYPPLGGSRQGSYQRELPKSPFAGSGFPKPPLTVVAPDGNLGIDDGSYWDFEAMSKDEIDDVVMDEVITTSIMNVLVDLAAEKAKVEKYKQLLGMS